MLLIKLRSEVLKMQNSEASWMVPEAGKDALHFENLRHW